MNEEIKAVTEDLLSALPSEDRVEDAPYAFRPEFDVTIAEEQAPKGYRLFVLHWASVPTPLAMMHLSVMNELPYLEFQGSGSKMALITSPAINREESDKTLESVVAKLHEAGLKVKRPEKRSGGTPSSRSFAEDFLSAMDNWRNGSS